MGFAVAFRTLTRYAKPSTGLGERESWTAFSRAALRPSIVSRFGSLSPGEVFARRFRSKFLFCGIIAAAGLVVDCCSMVWRSLNHLMLSTVTGMPSPDIDGATTPL